MNAEVSIIMGSTSDLPVMEEAAKILNELQIPFEINALSAHRTPDEVKKFAKSASGGISSFNKLVLLSNLLTARNF